MVKYWRNISTIIKTKTMKKILIIILGAICSHSYSQNLTDTENYIYKKTYLSDPSDPIQKQLETVQYLDGLGRPKQVISVKSTPSGQDMVLPIVYDQFGRKAKDYLPVPIQSSNAGIQTSVTESTVNSYYGVTNAFSEKELESSPLSRIFQFASPGEEWKMNSGNTVKYSYDANSTADQVKKYQVTTTWDNVNQIYNSALSETTLYDENSLYKFSIKDEDNNEDIVFKDLYEHIVLIRKNDGAHNIDTYYVYDSNDHLAYIIPPLASTSSVVTQSMLDNLCYQYRYDNKKRLVEKKIPGKGLEYMIYDKQDRLVLSQDAVLRTVDNNFTKRGWLFTKYDQLGRTVYTGFFANAASRTVMQTALSNMASWNNEKRTTTPFTLNGMDIYYTKDSFPTGSMMVLGVNYYDTYPPLPTDVSIPPYIITPTQSVLTQDAQNSSRSTKGFHTASYTKNIEDDNWTKDFVWYDTKGRAVGTYSVNHLGGYTKTEAELDFAGVPKQNKTYHKRLTTDIEKIITETFEYDSQNRLKVQKHKIDNNPEEVLAQYEYNEISQLKTKKVGGKNIALPLQTVDYTYNIRGWMTAVNDPNNLGNDLFGYKIKYTQREGLEIPNSDFPELKVKPKYNGNIAEVDWKTSTEENEPLKRYGYSYDSLNRLLGGFYQKEGNENAKEYFEKLEYDLNGNIQRLKRSGAVLQGNNTAILIDNLKYDYTENKLTKVTEEQIGNNNGYPYLVVPNAIGYDNNGSMTSQLDKGISSIKYNYLNLPTQVAQNSMVTNYTYRADGTKVKKLFGDTQTDYLDGLQYKSTKPSESGTGGLINNGDPSEVAVIKLRIIPTTEGYYDALNQQYIYNFTDHLGNVRLSYTDTNNDGIVQPRQYHTQECEGTWNPPFEFPVCIDYWKPGEIVEVNNYYPFGLQHNYTQTTQNAYQYKYQGQELQENGWYSFKWRNYMPDVGRFFNIDPLSEMYAYQSHYNFSENRVIDAREIEGLEAQTVNKTGTGYTGGLYEGTKNTNDGSSSLMKDSGGNTIGANISTIDLGTFSASTFNSGIGNGFVDTFKGIGNFISDPAAGISNAVSNYTWGDYGNSLLNSYSFGLYGQINGLTNFGNNLYNGNNYDAGYQTGEAVAGVAIALATEGAGRGVKTIAKGGAARAAQYSQSWENSSLTEAINKFAPNAKVSTTTKGKTIYKSSETGVQVVHDNNGNYFRIQDTNLSGKRSYLDMNGNIPNNKAVNGKIKGRSQGEYNQVTHFNNID